MNTRSLRNRLAAPTLMALGLFTAPVLAAAPVKEAPPAAAAPKPLKALVRTEFKLDNGLEVSLLPYGDMPKVAVQLAVDTGNVHEKANEIWLADLMGKLLVEGTTTRSAEQLAQVAAGLGGQLNVGTSVDQTFVGIEALSEFAPEAVALIADVSQHPAFPPPRWSG